MKEKNTIVADASSLIGLARIGKLHLLYDLYGEVVIPQAVYDEVVCEYKQASEEIRLANYLKIVEAKDTDLVNILLGYLGKGEAEVIALSKEIKADIVLVDEKRARKSARRVGFKVMGILGLLLVAKKKGLIPLLRPFIDELLREGFRLSDQIIETALEKAEEQEIDE